MIKKLFILALIYSSILTGVSAENFRAIPEQISGKRVYDETGTLSQEQTAQIEKKILQLEKEKGSQIAVLIIDSTLPESIEEYSIRVFEKWKPGRAKIDDGILMTFAMNDRKMRIEVGYGLEGILPDVICRRITSEIIKPEFKKENYFEGIEKGTDAVISIIQGEVLPSPAPREEYSFDSIVFSVLTSVFMLTGLLVSFFASRKFFLFMFLLSPIAFAVFLPLYGYITAIMIGEMIIAAISFIGAIIINHLNNKKLSREKSYGSGTPFTTYSTASSSDSWSDSSSSSSSSSSDWSSSSDSSSSSDFGGGDSGGGGSSDSW